MYRAQYTVYVYIHTMSIHSVYLVSDLEGSDNGDPLNRHLFWGSLPTRSTSEVVRSMKCSYRNKNLNRSLTPHTFMKVRTIRGWEPARQSKEAGVDFQ